MGVDWSNVQRQRVEAVLEAHPAASGRCEQAARGVLPVARELSSFGSCTQALAKGGMVRSAQDIYWSTLVRALLCARA
jgi:hypothetical protein